MKLDKKIAAIGILAGVTGALLVLGALKNASLSFTLYAISTLPILIAGLGWGHAAAALAVLAASGTIAVAVAPKAGLFVAIISFLPAGWISHLANLARPAVELGGPKDMLAWYPLPNILLHLCLIVSVAVLLTGYMIGYGPELIDQLVDMIMQASAGQPGAPAPDPVAIEQTKRVLLHVLPAAQAMTWVATQFVTYYLATRIVATTGRPVRPRENMNSALRMNRNAIFVMLGGLALSFVDGPLGLVGATVCGAFGAGFLMAGFAVLHFRTRGKPWRLPLLVLLYPASFFLLLPAIAIMVLGLMDTRQAIALTSAPGAGAADTPKS
nr:DUF2232 domain-containing protein [Gellertiella hungarica]